MQNQPDYTTNTSRRHFLKGLGIGFSTLALGSSSLFAEDWKGPSIKTIETFPITYPMASRFKFFEDPEGDLRGRASCVVKITTEEGTTGWGESIPVPRWSYETLESVTTTVRNYLAPILKGHPVFDIAGAHRKMNRTIASSFSTGQPIAKSGIDIALHDAVGKLSSESIPQRWGRKPSKKIALSWTLNPKTLDDVGRLIEKGRKKGYQHFNVKLGRNREYDLQLCRLVREAAPDAFLWADVNGGYTRNQALQIAPELADIGVDVLEQPLPHNQLTGYRELKKQADLPILMDESVVSPSTLMEFIRLNVLDGVAMKIPRSGGLAPARRMIEILKDAGLMVLGSGLTDPGLSLAATLQLYGAFQYERPAALNGPQFLAESILKNPFQPKNGHLKVPNGPGLGVDVVESKLKKQSVSLGSQK